MTRRPWQRPATPEAMRAHAATLRARADALEAHATRRFDNAPGAFVTGGSGRRRSGLHRKTERAADGALRDLAGAKHLRERATVWLERANRNDPEWLAAEERRKNERGAVLEEARRRESARRKAAPILNRPAAHWHMAAAEWARIHGDYKGLSVVEVDGASYRLRRAMRGGGSEEVFLVDRKAREAAQ